MLRDQGGQRLYALQDASGSTTAVVNASGVVQKRYAYEVDGRPVAYQADWSGYTAGSNSLDTKTSRVGWQFLWRGQRWHAFYQEDINGHNGCGLYEAPSGGQWYDPQHDRLVQPNPTAPPGTNAYDPHVYFTVLDRAILPTLQVAALFASFTPAAEVAIPISILLGGAQVYADGGTWGQIGTNVAIQSALAYGPGVLARGLSYLPTLASDMLYTAGVIRSENAANWAFIKNLFGRPPRVLAAVDGGVGIGADDLAAELEGAGAAAAAGGMGNWGVNAAWGNPFGNVLFSIKQVTSGNHFFPRQFGNQMRYGHALLTPLSQFRHRKFHSSLEDYLAELPAARRVRIDSVTGQEVDLSVSNVSQQLVTRNWTVNERYSILKGFFKDYNQGEYLPNFLREWKYAKANGLIK